MLQHVVGEKLRKQIVVDRANLASTVGSGSIEVFSTPSVVTLMESAAVQLAQKHLSNELTTVGTMINIEHNSPSILGMIITAEAELVNCDRRKLFFKVTASDDVGQIAFGTHERFIINIEKFVLKAKERKSQGNSY